MQAVQAAPTAPEPSAVAVEIDGPHAALATVFTEWERRYREDPVAHQAGRVIAVLLVANVHGPFWLAVD
jgi:hypothetical protein